MAVATTEIPGRPRQNWVVGPASDMLLIIGAPLLAWIWTAFAFQKFGAEFTLQVFMVFNVAHHFPTFIRIYGDKNLFQRFRWSLLLGPIIPFTIAMFVLSYIIVEGYPLTNLLFIMMILTVWDPWHFLMQHFGFMRIYDRHNQAPRRLAWWMDYGISATWFIYIMIAAADWFCDLLYNLHIRHGVTLLKWFDAGVYSGVLTIGFAAAVTMSCVYAGYLLWCFLRGYYVSFAKLLMLVIMFGVMFVTYVPNGLMASRFPGWTFAVGFATIGMVHVSQYLAIVWKYNRSLAKNPQRSRAGVFRWSFAKGGIIIALIYTAICLFYGLCLTEGSPIYAGFNRFWDRNSLPMHWVWGVLLSLNFTSTLMHYYYDGFIWKVRHKENRENLAMAGKESAGNERAISSWWDKTQSNTPTTAFFRHMLYFGVPLLALMATFAIVSRSPSHAPIKLANEAFQLWRAGDEEKSVQQAKIAMAAMQEQVELETRMEQLRSVGQRHRITTNVASHQAYIAELTYTISKTQLEILDRAKGGPTAEDYRRHRGEIIKAIDMLGRAMSSSGSLAHRENMRASHQDFDYKLAQWRIELENTAVKMQRPAVAQASPGS